MGNWFKIGMYLLNREKRCYAFPRSTDIIQVLNDLPTDKRHIKEPQDRQLCLTHIDNKKKTFSKSLVPLTIFSRQRRNAAFK